MPGIIADRLWSVFDQDKDDYLKCDEFVAGMTILFCENYDKLVRFIFYFYDFDKDGLISKEDIRTVLSYIPLNSSNVKSISKYDKLGFKDRVASQDELHETLNKCFENKETMDINNFIWIIENVSSDIFLFILIFLLEKKPFSLKTLQEFNKSNKFGNPLNRYVQTPQVTSRTLIMSPSVKSAFSPSVTISKSPFSQQRMLSLRNDPSKKAGLDILNKFTGKPQSEKNLLNNNTKSLGVLSQFTGKGPIVTNKKAVNTLKELQNVEKKDDDSMQVDENVTVKPIKVTERKPMKYLRGLEVNSSPNKNLIEGKVSNTDINESNINSNTNTNNSNNNDMVVDKNPTYTKNFKNDDEDLQVTSARKYVPEKNKYDKEMTPITDDSDEDDDFEEEAAASGYLYKISRGKKLKKRWFKLIHKDLYYYRNKDDTNYKGLHNLSGVFVKEGQKIEHSEYKFISFSLIFSNQTRIYLCENEEEYKKWIFNIKKATGYMNLNETYTVKEKLGNGKFGIVRLGINKQTLHKVAIKIMQKKNMSKIDLELVKNEIEILKICQHPNIIKLYDVYENAEDYYIGKIA